MTAGQGFVDLQVNGYAGVDFNGDALSIEQIDSVCETLASDGVSRILATIITAPLVAMERRIRCLAAAIAESDTARRRIAGIHVEGPFISPRDGFVGAHPVESVLSADVDIAKRLIDAGAGTVRLVTLAPEQDRDQRVTGWLASQGIIVAAGHSDASISQLRASIDAGLRMYTHLGNGCPAQMNRHDNIIQRVLSLSDRLSVSFIADGHHVPMFALKNYLSAMPDQNIVVVSDAISAAGLGTGRFPLGDQFVEVDEDGAAWSADRSHFAGSAATIARMRSVLAAAGFAADAIDRWTIDHPRELLS